jgi:hypothetical protein
MLTFLLTPPAGRGPDADTTPRPSTPGYCDRGRCPNGVTVCAAKASQEARPGARTSSNDAAGGPALQFRSRQQEDNPRVSARSARGSLQRPHHPGGTTTAGPSGSHRTRGAASGRSDSPRRRNRPMGRAIRSASQGLSPTATAMTDTAQLADCPWRRPHVALTLDEVFYAMVDEMLTFGGARTDKVALHVRQSAQHSDH